MEAPLRGVAEELPLALDEVVIDGDAVEVTETGAVALPEGDTVALKVAYTRKDVVTQWATCLPTARSMHLLCILDWRRWCERSKKSKSIF